MGRDDVVVWPVTAANVMTSPSAITRCVIHCKRDGEQDVIIDSTSVPAAFIFNEQATVRGKLVNVLKWLPGLAVGEQFTESAKWKCQVFLFDAVHTSGVDYGAFWLDVVFAELPAGAAVDYVAGSGEAFTSLGASPSIGITGADIDLDMSNSLIDPAEYPDAVVVLTMSVQNTAGGSLGFGVDTVDIGGVSASFREVDASPNGIYTHKLIQAVARIPEGGFSGSAVIVTMTGAVGSPATVKAITQAFYNVDPSSDSMSLSYVTDSDSGSAQLTHGDGNTGTSGTKVGFSATGAPSGQFGDFGGSLNADAVKILGYYLAEAYTDSSTDEFVLTLYAAPADLAFTVALGQSGNDGVFGHNHRQLFRSDAATSVTLSGSYRTWRWPTAWGIDEVVAPNITINPYFDVVGVTNNYLNVPTGGAVAAAIFGSSEGAPYVTSAEVQSDGSGGLSYVPYESGTSVSGTSDDLRSQYRLFTAASSTEQLHADDNLARAVAAFVMAGTA